MRKRTLERALPNPLLEGKSVTCLVGAMEMTRHGKIKGGETQHRWAGLRCANRRVLLKIAAASKLPLTQLKISVDLATESAAI